VLVIADGVVPALNRLTSIPSLLSGSIKSGALCAQIGAPQTTKGARLRL
jgi:hypothetical protein